MIQKKVCLLGTSGVGKTSLVAQFVHSMFSDKYLTTVGVKIDKKSVTVDGTEVTTSGYLLVADGTRKITLDQALELQKRVAETLGAAPFVLALNKADLAPQWEVDETRIAGLTAQNFTLMKTSAKEGAGVEEAFAYLARRMIEPA
jgi:GTPase SAR1 family protein